MRYNLLILLVIYILIWQFKINVIPIRLSPSFRITQTQVEVHRALASPGATESICVQASAINPNWNR